MSDSYEEQVARNLASIERARQSLKTVSVGTVQDLIAEAVAKERARCAAVCERLAVRWGEPSELTEWGLGRHAALLEAAAAIRAPETGDAGK